MLAFEEEIKNIFYLKDKKRFVRFDSGVGLQQIGMVRISGIFNEMRIADFENMQTVHS